MYLNLPLADIKMQGSSLLLWWKSHEGVLPNLAALAKKYLVIPGSSATSKCLFSLSGGIVSPSRTNIASENVSMSVFWIKNMEKLENCNKK